MEVKVAYASKAYTLLESKSMPSMKNALVQKEKLVNQSSTALSSSTGTKQRRSFSEKTDAASESKKVAKNT